MPTPREDFEADPYDFMKRNAVEISAAGIIQNSLTGTNRFQNLRLNEDRVSLTAPQGYAELTPLFAKREHPYIKCSVPQYKLALTQDATQIPVYVIPYAGGSGYGVKLPTGHGRAIAITTRIDGCTFTVSGSAGEPYASHSNAYIAGGTPQQKTDKIRDHVLEIERQFKAEELNTGGNDQVGVNRTHFNYWHRSQLGRPSGFVNYAEFAQQRSSLETETRTHHYRESCFIGHKKFHVRLSDQSQNEIAAETFIPKNAVIGVREAGSWTFYFSTFWDVIFDVREEFKIGGTVKSDATTQFPCTAVMTYGTIWPNIEVRYRPFLTQVGRKPK